MNYSSIDSLKPLSPQLLEKIPYLKMLVLFGSQATGETHAESDWDFAVLYDETLKQEHLKQDILKELEIPLILGEIFHLNRDKIDVVNLNHCSPLLSYQVAKNGQLIYELSLGQFTKFRIQAWKKYADTAKFRKIEKESINLWLQKIGV